MRKGDDTCIYSGSIVESLNGLSEEEIDYTYQIRQGRWLVGSRYLNYGDGFRSKVNSGKPFIRPNAEFAVDGSRGDSIVYLRCTRLIRKGSEVYVAYGSGYWNRKRALALAE